MACRGVLQGMGHAAKHIWRPLTSAWIGAALVGGEGARDDWRRRADLIGSQRARGCSQVSLPLSVCALVRLPYFGVSLFVGLLLCFLQVLSSFRLFFLVFPFLSFYMFSLGYLLLFGFDCIFFLFLRCHISQSLLFCSLLIGIFLVFPFMCLV